MMNYIRHIRLSKNDKLACEHLVIACHQADGTFHQPYLDNLYNFDQTMPSFVLAYQEEQLVGFLSIYADEPGEATVELFVNPANRRQGIARRLWQEFDSIARDYQLGNVTYTTEQVFIDQYPDFVAQCQLTKNGECELWMSRPNQKFPLEMRETVQVVLGSKDNLESIARFQAKAFGHSLDVARHYAQESIQNPEALLYVLQEKDRVLASVTVDVSQGSNHFFGLAVDPDVQGQGLATYLMKSAMNQLADQNSQHFLIVVEEENLPALHLYQKLGFEVNTAVVYLTKVK